MSENPNAGVLRVPMEIDFGSLFTQVFPSLKREV